MGDGEMVVGDGKVAFPCGRRISGVDLRLSSPDIVVATLQLASCLFYMYIYLFILSVFKIFMLYRSIPLGL